jgi:hypothetical protein
MISLGMGGSAETKRLRNTPSKQEPPGHLAANGVERTQVTIRKKISSYNLETL